MTLYIQTDINDENNETGRVSRRLARSLDRLRAFPERVRREAGFQLDRVQRGLEPDDWKPMQTIGPGVREIRVKDTSGAYRVVYIASFAEAVYLLHVFQKKTQRTAPRDLALAQSRFRELKRGA